MFAVYRLSVISGIKLLGWTVTVVMERLIKKMPAICFRQYSEAHFGESLRMHTSLGNILFILFYLLIL